MEFQYGTQALTDFLAARHQIIWGEARTEASTQKARQQNGVSDDTVPRGFSQDQSGPANASEEAFDIARY